MGATQNNQPRGIYWVPILLLKGPQQGFKVWERPKFQGAPTIFPIDSRIQIILRSKNLSLLMVQLIHHLRSIKPGTVN